ncbi:hypothetical protein [Amylibacter sp. IMCC11727]|uniref:CBU_0592 family membrane protein n=1 Tax=Amylibacter sp. IMCC11727 TaxID=3039851 RepID=UPI00244DCC5B|nr:hypothetical protein [Amylibacter sp. IMCC11727]WGI23420.1 hypothetical protein QBD29_08330 [Amylibacter sp. IMCC11727]
MSDHFSSVRDLMSIFDLSLICNGIGVLGFIVYLASYTLVTFQRIDSRGMLFFTLNTTAATFVLISLTQNFNLASALIQVVWIGLGVIAIVTRLSRPAAAS